MLLIAFWGGSSRAMKNSGQSTRFGVYIAANAISFLDSHLAQGVKQCVLSAAVFSYRV